MSWSVAIQEFRITVWDRTQQMSLYENFPLNAATAQLMTYIGAGLIVIPVEGSIALAH